MESIEISDYFNTKLKFCPYITDIKNQNLLKYREIHNDLILVIQEKISSKIQFTLFIISIENPIKTQSFILNFTNSKKENITDFLPNNLLINKNEDLLIIYSENNAFIGKIPTIINSDLCQFFKIDFDLAEMPKNPLKILKIEFAHLNDSYFGIFLSNNKFLLYNATADLSKSEQIYDLTKFGLSKLAIPTSFCFGTKFMYGFESFSVHFLFENGEIYTLNPIIPHNLYVEPQFFIKIQELFGIKSYDSQNEDEKIYLQSKNFINLLIESYKNSGYPLKSLEINIDSEKMQNFKPILQGPIQILRYTHETENQEIYKEIINFDYFPYLFVLKTENGNLEILFSFEDCEMSFKPEILLARQLFETSQPKQVKKVKNIKKCDRKFILHDKIYNEIKENCDILYNKFNPFYFYVLNSKKIYKITNNWINKLSDILWDDESKIEEKRILKKNKSSKIKLFYEETIKYCGVDVFFFLKLRKNI